MLGLFPRAAGMPIELVARMSTHGRLYAKGYKRGVKTARRNVKVA